MEPEPTKDATSAIAGESLATLILESSSAQTLDLPAGMGTAEAKAILAELATDRAWAAYDLVHQLQVYGRAF